MAAIQADAFSVDMRASLAAYHALAVQNREQLLEREVYWLTAAGIDLVVSDTVPLACAAAHRAKLPAVVCSNFSWGAGHTLAENRACSDRPLPFPPSPGGFSCTTMWSSGDCSFPMSLVLLAEEG